MSELEKRKKAAEAKFAVGEELVFKATIKRDRIVSKWMASKFFSMDDKETSDFIESAVKANLERPGDDDILEFFEDFFSQKGQLFDRNKIVEKLAVTYESILDEDSNE